MVYIVWCLGHSIELSYITLNWPLDKMPRQGLILTKAQEIYKGMVNLSLTKRVEEIVGYFITLIKKSSQREKR